MQLKQLVLAAIFCAPLILRAQSHALEKLWETDTVVAVPESVLPDASHKHLYVSLIDGGPWDVDGKGGVGRLGIDGKVYDGNWIRGMNAPKGLGRYGNRLYVADISEVVVIDIQKGAIEKKISVEGANGLNDITVDANGVVYVSDSRSGKVYRIEKDIPTLYMENLAGANGLKAHGSNLYVLANKAVLDLDAGRHIRTITTLPNGGDGVEEADNGDLIVSEWVGYIYYVYADGRRELLLDTHLQKKNTADIHYDRAAHILYVPGFNAKTVAAYRLKGKGTPGSAAVYLMNADSLTDMKKRMSRKDQAAMNFASILRKGSDEKLNMRPFSVMDKSRTPMSGDRHDYMSQAPYFWYDSSRPNGLPYMRRDGQRNPEIYTITDRTCLGNLESAVELLSMTWYLTEESKYAAKAAQLLRHWFLDDSTRMNPNLQYAQAVPGINDGRGIGIIETIALTNIADGATLLEGSPSWSTNDADSLRQWYAQYLDWMLNSRNGKDEHAAKNNHGTWYLAQAVDFALFTGNIEKAHQLAEEGKKLIDSQIRSDGRMPLELERTNGLGYSTYNLRAWFELATLARSAGVDLWNYHNPDGAGIQTALDWLIPYALGEKKWEYQQISKYSTTEIFPLLMKAAVIYNNPEYRKRAAKAGSKGSALTTPATGE